MMKAFCPCSMVRIYEGGQDYCFVIVVSSQVYLLDVKINLQEHMRMLVSLTRANLVYGEFDIKFDI